MSHSKRNTSRPVFTSHERALAKSNWGANTARLSRESFLPFGSCGLCLGIARDPVSCRRGDIFCRECALANILSQKKDIKRAEKARRNAAEESAKAQALEDEEDQQRAVRDFELTQAGLDRAKDGAKRPTVNDEQGDTPAAPGTKRKFSLDDDELERIAREDKIKARKAIDDEKAAKPTLPSFWSPSVTPDLNTNKLPNTEKRTKTFPTCPGSNAENPHSLTMQNLITINFNEETDSSSETKRRTCPSCLKVLSNSSSPTMVKQCGHVICNSCVKQFMVPAKKSSSSEPQIPPTCYVCDTPLPTKAAKDDTSASSSIPGLVALKSDGTGFSARGSSTVEKSTVSFQC